MEAIYENLSLFRPSMPIKHRIFGFYIKLCGLKIELLINYFSISVYMKITGAMIKTFKRVVLGDNTIPDIAINLGIGETRTGEILTLLEKEGFIEKKRKSRSKEILISKNKHAMYLRDLMLKRPNKDFSEVLDKKKPYFLYFLSNGWTRFIRVKELSKLNNVTILTYYKPFIEQGIIQKDKYLYRLNSEEWPILKKFVVSYKIF